MDGFDAPCGWVSAPDDADPGVRASEYVTFVTYIYLCSLTLPWSKPCVGCEAGLVCSPQRGSRACRAMQRATGRQAGRQAGRHMAEPGIEIALQSKTWMATWTEAPAETACQAARRRRTTTGRSSLEPRRPFFGFGTSRVFVPQTWSWSCSCSMRTFSRSRRGHDAVPDGKANESPWAGVLVSLREICGWRRIAPLVVIDETACLVWWDNPRVRRRHGHAIRSFFFFFFFFPSCPRLTLLLANPAGPAFPPGGPTRAARFTTAFHRLFLFFFPSLSLPQHNPGFRLKKAPTAACSGSGSGRAGTPRPEQHRPRQNLNPGSERWG